MKFDPIDVNGKDLQVGDWVRVLCVALSIRNMPDETKTAFSKAVGETLQIESLDEIGYLELDFWPKFGCDTIWLDPFCVERFRRHKKLSKRFKKILELNKGFERPEFVFIYTAKWPQNGTYEDSLACFDFEDWDIVIGHGWSVWSEDRRIEGTLSIHKHKKNSLERIKNYRLIVKSLNYFENIKVGEIQSRESNLLGLRRS